MGICMFVRPKRRVGHLNVELVFMLSKEEDREVVEWRDEVRLTSRAAVAAAAAEVVSVAALVLVVAPTVGVVHCCWSDESKMALVNALMRSSFVAMVPRDAWCAKADFRFWKRSNCLAWWPSS